MNRIKFNLATDFAKIRNEELTLGIFKPTRLIHEDGSSFSLTHGCYERLHLNGTDFIILYGEHYHPMIFYADDVESVDGPEISHS
jgi:hypothetical protein